MSMFGFTQVPDINEGVKECRDTEGAVLLDVRTPEEYKEGHVPGSTHLSLQQIQNAPEVLPDKSTPLFVYCLSGARSQRAVSYLSGMGYTNVRNIGGIDSWSGDIE